MTQWHSTQRALGQGKDWFSASPVAISTETNARMVTNPCDQAMQTSVACSLIQLTGNFMKRSFSPLLLALLSAFFLTSLSAVAQTTVSVTTDVAETTEGVEPGESLEPVKTVHQVRQKRDLSTSIALASLAKQDVTDPTVEQVDSAVSDVNAMRASGMGWGLIANTLGLRLGDVVSASRAANKQDRRMAKTGEDATNERHVAKPVRETKRVREALPAQSTEVASSSASTSMGTSAAGERAARGTAKGSASSGQGSNAGGSNAGGSGGKAGGSSAGQSSGSGGSKGSGNSSGGGKGNSNSSGGGKGGSGGGKGGGNNGGGGHGGKR